ncbi:MAG: alpha/beta fold hydrolase [Nocardioidaceae bacterium]
MKSAATARRYVGLTGALIGVVATGAAAGILAERTALARRRAARPVEGLGSLRGERHTVMADDGVELFAEIDDLTPGATAQAQITVVFVHAYAVNLDSWHYQRAALRGSYRLVFFDQRSHGRSGRSSRANSTIDQTGRDLAKVIEQLVPHDRLVLVGHSMGGMTILALADQCPDLFQDRVAGVALVATSAEGLTAEVLGLPGLPGRVIHRLTPALVATLARTPRLVETGRRATSDIGSVMTRKLAFGGPVAQELVDFTDSMLTATPFEVVAEFFPGFGTHDKREALQVLQSVPSIVICGSGDSITPIDLSHHLGELAGSEEVVELSGAGHMVILERPIEVTAAIERLIGRAAGRSLDPTSPDD